MRDSGIRQNATYILKVSNNRGAQTMVCLMTVSGGSRDCDAGLPETAKEFQKAGINPKGAALVDGSGFARNYITPDSITELLRVFHDHPDAAVWQQAMPIMGVDGTTAAAQKDSPAAGKVFAKTGTLAGGVLMNNRVRLEKAPGGYIDAKSDRALVFAVVINQAMFEDIAGLSAANEDIGKIASALHEQY